MMIGVRTHGGPGIGLGHVRRCLALAAALKQLRADVLFIVEEDVDTWALIERHSFGVRQLAAGSDEPAATLQAVHDAGVSVLIADSYDIDTTFFEAVRPHVRMLVTLDDLADRRLPVDVVINAALGVEASIYADLTAARLLLGAPYCLLREEFARQPDRLIRPHVEQVLITVGGSDPHRLTGRLIDWTRQVLPAAQLDVIVGPYFDWQPPGADTRLATHIDPPNMRELMLKCDLAISGGGQTTLELAATGTPALAIQVADNQTQNLAGLSRAGVLELAGRADDPDLAKRVRDGLGRLIANPGRRAAMSAQGRALIDGQGARRAAQAILAAAQEV